MTNTSDFRLEVEIWPFHAYIMKICNTYNHYLWPNLQNCRILQEIVVEEHDGDVKFQTRSRNMAVSRMQNENYAI